MFRITEWAPEDPLPVSLVVKLKTFVRWLRRCLVRRHGYRDGPCPRWMGSAWYEPHRLTHVLVLMPFNWPVGWAFRLWVYFLNPWWRPIAAEKAIMTLVQQTRRQAHDEAEEEYEKMTAELTSIRRHNLRLLAKQLLEEQENRKPRCCSPCQHDRSCGGLLSPTTQADISAEQKKDGPQ